MKEETLSGVLKKKGLLTKLQNLVSGEEKLSESQLQDVVAGSERGCVIYIGDEPCVIWIGPPQLPQEDSGQ